MLLGQVVKPLIMRHYTLQGPITGIAIRLPTVEAGHRPGCDTDVVGDWDHNNAPGPLAFRTSTKFGDNQPLDLVLGLRELFHGPHSHRLGSRTTAASPYVGWQRIDLKAVGSGDGRQAVLPPRLRPGVGRRWERFGDPPADSAAVEALARPLRRRAAPATCHRPATNWPIVRWQQWRNGAQKSPDARRWYRVELVEKQTRWWAGMLTMRECDG
jgi:hypothetical protein